ncbi:MAG: hypothetical protein OQJ81_10860 [Melioribacteraceae bacterium]|nr:hypothetical protein [Melioribacteraceae bacterium]
MEKKVLLLVLVYLFSNIGFAQRYSPNSVSLSVYAGDLAIVSEKFSTYYGSKNDFTFGVGFGIPLNNTWSITTSATYFHKKSNSTAENQFDPSQNSVLKQIIFNTGAQINLLPNRIVGLSFLAGVSYSLINESRKTSNGTTIAKIEGSGNLGLYGGAIFELSLGRSPFSFFGDAKYTYSWDPLLTYEDSYREIRFTGGLKIYLAKRWKKY